MAATFVKTICFECHCRCGVILEVVDGKITGIQGDKVHPFSHGYTCPKGRACMEIYHPDRITSPLVKVGGKESKHFEKISWEKALEVIAENLLTIRKKWGAESVVFGSATTRKMAPYLNKFLAINKEDAFIEPAAVALHAVNLAGVTSSDTVCIIGGGPIGILCAIWAKLFDASCVVIVEVDSFRMSFIASHITVDGVIDCYDTDIRKKLKTISQGGFTVAIETSATDTGLYTALAALKPRGRMVMAGINFYGQPVPTLSLIAKEITVLGSMGYSIDEFDDVIENLAEKKLALEALVTHSVSLEDVPVVFNNLAQKSIEAIKVVVQP